MKLALSNRIAVLAATAVFVASFFCSACSSAMQRDKKVDVATLSISAIGPLHRDHLSVEATSSSNLKFSAKDLFQFVLLYGEPPTGNYDWFKIARSNSDPQWYLVLGSEDGAKEWLEPGRLIRDDKNRRFTFVVERELGGEGDLEKSTRTIAWSDESPDALSVTLNIWTRFFLNPVWGAPATLQVEMRKK